MAAKGMAGKRSCLLPSAGASTQIVSTPIADSTLTATITGQLVAMANCCQSLLENEDDSVALRMATIRRRRQQWRREDCVADAPAKAHPPAAGAEAEPANRR